MTSQSRLFVLVLVLAWVSTDLRARAADAPRVFPVGQKPNDVRLGPLRTLDGSYFPMRPIDKAGDWPARRAEIRTRVLVAAGLHPLPERCPLKAIVYGKVERDDYTVERVIFESFPGHYVTGSLYRPKSPAKERRAAVLCPYGHWENGRFQDEGADGVRRQIASGAEKFERGGRHIIQARCVQLARMGCVAFVYDMEGMADSVQLPHRPGIRAELPDKDGYLFFSPQAELHGQTMFGLQTWNSIRALDFIESLPDVDRTRIGVTGESGGGTQSMILGAIDDRIAACFPVVMVSTAMQGGCTCENAAYLRINHGNIDIAAAVAPRPLGLIAADDWTKELQTKGYPDLAALYKMLGCSDRIEAHFHLQFPHNYNAVNRQHMYSFMNRHLKLGLPEPIVERDYVPLETATEASVWTKEHPKPTGDQVGLAHERRLTAEWTKATEAVMRKLDKDGRRKLVAEGLATIIGRLPDEVGPVKFEEANTIEEEGYCVRIGKLSVVKQREQLPAMFIEPVPKGNRRAVIWLTDGGKQDLFGPDGKLIPTIARLVRHGYTVASIDMFGQGEFVSSGKSLEVQRVVQNSKGNRSGPQPTCYTFGYNPPLAAQRVHDVMSLAKFVSDREDTIPSAQIDLVAIGQEAGPVGLLARDMLAGRIHRAATDTCGFDFHKLNRLDDPMFLPGILRYGGLAGLWQAASRHETVKVRGANEAADRFSRGE
jgi:dienelactone hydrolase